MEYIAQSTNIIITKQKYKVEIRNYRYVGAHNLVNLGFRAIVS